MYEGKVIFGRDLAIRHGRVIQKKSLTGPRKVPRIEVIKINLDCFD